MSTYDVSNKNLKSPFNAKYKYYEIYQGRMDQPFYIYLIDVENSDYKVCKDLNYLFEKDISSGDPEDYKSTAFYTNYKGKTYEIIIHVPSDSEIPEIKL